MNMRSRSLYLKFNLLIVGMIFLCGLLIGGLMLHTITRSLQNELDTSGQKIAASLGVAIANDVLLDDRFAVSERLMKTMATSAQVRYIIATAPDGRIMATTFDNGLPAGLPVQREVREDAVPDIISFDSNEGGIREILYPIDEGVIGSLRVGMTEHRMNRLIRERCLEMGVMVFLICFVASLLATRYARHFLEPLRIMGGAVRAIGAGNYNVSVQVEAEDETGRLAKAFNKMIERLRVKEQENSTLLRELQAKERARVWLINQLFTAREDERHRISRELHDETGQSMASILAYLRVLHDRLETNEQREMLLAVRDLTADTLAGLRRLAVDLHPPMLEDLGLVIAIEKYLETFRRTQPQIAVEMKTEGDFTKLSRTISLVCYRTLQEALTNIIRHAQAHRVDISMSCTPHEIRLSIFDDGVGFDRKAAEEARRNRHLGLVSMKERVELLNGEFSIVSRPQGGTHIHVVLPADAMDGVEEKKAGVLQLEGDHYGAKEKT